MHIYQKEVFTFILVYAYFLFSCSSPTEIDIVSISQNTPLPSLTISENLPTIISSDSTVTPTRNPGFITVTPSRTPVLFTLTPTSKAQTSTPVKVAVFDFCKEVKSGICIRSFVQVGNVMNVVLYVDEQINKDTFFVRVDNHQYNCLPVATEPTKFICMYLPLTINSTISIQFFSSSSSSVPLAEGKIFLYQALLQKPTSTPEEKAEPPDPYKP